MTTKKLSDKKVFTTGEVAQLLGININTVIKWFDEGKIQGFRLPSSNDRRIPIAHLRNFMSAHQIPMDLLEDGSPMRRLFKRVPCTEAVRFSISNGRAYGPYDGELADLSQGGARVLTTGGESLAIPMHPFRVDLSFKEGPLAAFQYSGQIVHLTPGQEMLSLGLRFSDLAEDAEFGLKRYLDGRC